MLKYVIIVTVLPIVVVLSSLAALAHGIAVAFGDAYRAGRDEIGGARRWWNEEDPL